MQSYELPYAGLILPDGTDLDPLPFLKTAAAVLERLETNAERAPRLSTRRVAVLGAQYGLRVRPEEDSDYGPRMVLEVITRGNQTPDDEFAARLLSDTVLASLEHCGADIIEWYSPDVLLGREDFIRLRSYVSPRRGPGLEDAPAEEADQDYRDILDDSDLSDEFRSALYDMHEDEGQRPAQPENQLAVVTNLRGRIADSSPEEIRMGAASWMLTGVVAVFSFPVAAFLGLIGLLRGMDFRLTAQALSVTMLFVALGNTNSINRIVASIFH